MTAAKFYTPTVTAFDAQGNLDPAGNRAVLDHVIDGGVDGVVVMGSTGEFASMREADKRALIDLTVEHVAGRAEVIMGTACMRVDDTIELSNYALDAGVDAVMVIGPWYFALEDAAVEAYFCEVAAGVRGDLYLYNFPARTGYSISPEVTARVVRKHPNVVGYKDTVLEVGHTRRLLTTLRPEFPDFRVLAGFDENLAHVVASGGAGVIGGLSNVFPEVCSAYTDAVNAQDFVQIARTQRVIDRLMGLYEIASPFIPIVKKAMTLRGVAIGETSLAPHQSATPEQTARVVEILADVEAMLR